MISRSTVGSRELWSTSVLTRFEDETDQRRYYMIKVWNAKRKLMKDGDGLPIILEMTTEVDVLTGYPTVPPDAV